MHLNKSIPIKMPHIIYVELILSNSTSIKKLMVLREFILRSFNILLLINKGINLHSKNNS